MLTCNRGKTGQLKDRTSYFGRNSIDYAATNTN